MISAQWTTNRHGTKYRYYRCSKKRGRCSQSYLQEKDLAEQIQKRLQTISLPNKYTDWMLDKIKEWEQGEVSVSKSEIHNLSSKINAGQTRLGKLVSTYLDGDISKDIYLKQKDKIMRACAALEEKKKDYVGGRNQWVEPLREWVNDTKQAYFLTNSPDYNKMKTLVQKIGTNPKVRDKSARFSFFAPSRFVATRRVALRSATLENMASRRLSKREVTFCGEGGIRTNGTRKSTHAFQACLFGRSSTSPGAPGRTRTSDPQLRKLMIYPLSYGCVNEECLIPLVISSTFIK